MLNLVFQITFAAFCTAHLTKFLSFAMLEGNILHGYYKWLIKVSKAHFITVVSDGEEFEMLHSAKWFYKAFGGCDKCMNFYVGLPPLAYLMATNSVSFALGFMMFWSFQSLSFYFISK